MRERSLRKREKRMSEKRGCRKRSEEGGVLEECNGSGGCERRCLRGEESVRRAV